MLHVHRSERADRLAAGLAAMLREAPADPFQVEVVAVPARGVERWLTQRLSHVLGAGSGTEDGVCALVRFPHPGDVVAAAVAVGRVAGGEDPWAPGPLLWALLEVVDECAAEDWCAPLAGHLGLGEEEPTHRRGRRLAAAQLLARRFHAYGESRPAMLQDWARGEDSDGAGRRLAADLRWQAQLWRRVRARTGLESPAERLPAACRAIREHPADLDLPPRLSLFGATRLSTAQLLVVAALAQGRDVHLWLPSPSASLWDRVVALAAPGQAPVRRRADPTADLPRHPLLASLGRDARELALRLGGAAARDRHLPVGERPATLLGRLQQALAEDAYDLGTGERALLRGDDRSLQVHACHGPARQVEVLREVLVGLLAADETLEPRDVLVMCPDVEDYAPLVSATFGLAEDPAASPGHRLRVRLADRSVRQTNPLLATVAALLELADARVTATQLLDLASMPPVRRRFGFADGDLERLQEWVATAGVRWGLDAPHRSRFGLAGVPQNTWRAGLDRVLLGAAMTEDDLRWVGLGLPLDDVDSNDVDLAGRLAELLDRCTAALDSLSGTQPLAGWLAAVLDALERLTAVPEEEAWQAGEARRRLAEVATAAGKRAGSVPLSLADVRALLADLLQGRPTRANFRTGELTVCSMVPMRSVPHRVVCLLGLDDGTFPRSSGVDGDDILARDPCLGERDPRSEDRQLLLDALLAARDHVVVLYTGADPRTNAPRPPAVPIGEILDAAADLVVTADGRAVRDHIVVRHPLQPFDARNFTAGALGVDRPFSFDRPALRGARRAAGPRREPGPFLPVPLPPPEDDETLALEDLVALLEQPARGFLRQRLSLSLRREEDEVADGLPVTLDPLEQWAVGDRLLRSRLAGAAAETCRQAEWRRGTLPPGELGARVLEPVLRDVEQLVADSAPLRQRDGRAVDVDVALDGPGNRRLTGTVGTVRGEAIVRVEYSRLAAKHRLRAWVQLLALSAARTDAGWTAVTLGRGSRRGPARSVLGPVGGDAARRILAELADLHGSGRCAPLPMAAKTSAAYATRRAAGVNSANALAFAANEWAGSSQIPGERAEEAHRLVWGPDAPLDRLLTEAPHPAEQGPGWPAEEPTRFGALARRLWEPLLAAEEREQR